MMIQIKRLFKIFPSHITVLTLIFLFALVACSPKSDCEKAPATAHIEIEWEWQNLINPLMEAKDVEEFWGILNDHPIYAQLFLDVGAYETEQQAKEATFAMFNHTSFRDTLYTELKIAFDDFEGLKSQFDQAFKYFQYYFPGEAIPKIQLVMGGLRQDLYVSDSLIIIGLDYFIGPEATFKPAGIPQYIMRRYHPESVVANVMLIFSQRYNKTDYENQSLIADMIFYGKSLEFVKRMLPCIDDRIVVGYTEEELRESKANEDIIWANFLQNDVLWETSHLMKSKFVGERPKTYEIGDKCPGRIGQWTGWQMVRQYLEKNSDISLKELMSKTDAEAIFHQSKYKPKVKR